jgi:hypothetical protein
VTFRERVNVADFESQHFAVQLVERLGWAVEDADRAERIPDASEDADRPERSPDGSEDVDGAERMRESADDTAEERASQRDERLTVPSPA